MLRSVIEPLFDHLLSAYPSDRKWQLSELDANTMPEPIICFLRQAIQRRLTFEADRFTSEWFDYNNDNVVRYRNLMLKKLGYTGMFPEDEWEKNLRKSVRLVVMYLSHPVHTLSAFVFGPEKDGARTEEILARMDYFRAYGYLRDVLGEYFRRKNIAEMSSEEFRKLLTRVDQKMVRDYSSDNWLVLLTPLFDLIRLVPGQEGVPVSILRMFFEEKGYTGLHRRLMYEEQMDETSCFDETRLKNLIDKIQNGETVSSANPVIIEEANEDDFPSDEIVAPPADDFIHESGILSKQEGQIADELFDEAVIDTPADNLEEFSPSNEIPAPLADEVETTEISPTEISPTEISPTDRFGFPIEPIANPETSSDLNDEIPLWKKLQNQANAEAEAVDEQSFTPPAETSSDATLFGSELTEEDIAPVNTPDLAPEPALATEIDVPDFGVSVTTEVVASQEENIPLWLKFQQGDSASVQTQTAENDFASIERTVLGKENLEHTTWFINGLFDGDQAQYEEALHKLHSAPTWTRASQIISDDIFNPRNINIYAEVAVTFTDAVESSYRTF